VIVPPSAVGLVTAEYKFVELEPELEPPPELPLLDVLLVRLVTAFL